MQENYNDKHITQAKICIQALLPGQKNYLTQISNQAHSRAHYKRKLTSLMHQNAWKNGMRVTISFISTSPTHRQVDWVPIEYLKNIRDSDGNPILLDPLEYNYKENRPGSIRKLAPIDAVRKVIRERFEPLVGLRFIFVPQGGNIRISFNPYKGNYSYLGTDSLQTTNSSINFGWLDVGAIMHQFCMALGLFQEHQVKKGQMIQWEEHKLNQWAELTYGYTPAQTTSYIIDRYRVSHFNSSKYDPKSIMLFFYPTNFTSNKKGVNPNMKLSLQDMYLLRDLYPVNGNEEMSVKEFYNFIYPPSTHSLNNIIGKFKDNNKQDITKKTKKSNFNWRIFLFIISAIVILILIILFVTILIKKINLKKNKSHPQEKSSNPTNFEQWKNQNKVSNIFVK